MNHLDLNSYLRDEVKKIVAACKQLDDQPQNFSNVLNSDHAIDNIARECLFYTNSKATEKFLKLPYTVKRVTGYNLSFSDDLIDFAMNGGAREVLDIINFNIYNHG